MNSSVDHYFTEGCGRCKYHATPQCKVHQWSKELALLRNIMKQTGLQETLKWGIPVYTYQNKNIVLISAFKDNCVVSFFKGAGLKDDFNILLKPGENTQASRVIRFTELEQIQVNTQNILNYVAEAVLLEKSGFKMVKQEKTIEYPQELLDVFEEYPAIQVAFEKLTPGKQKSYLLHFNQAKQSKTKMSRIHNCFEPILNGIGYNDLYKLKK